MGVAQARLARFFGDSIAFAVDQDAESRAFFADTFGVCCYASVEEAVWEALDLLWITVCDDQIGAVSQRVSRYVSEQCIVLHTSGLHSSQCLKAYLPHVSCASLHPLMACPLKKVTDCECVEVYKRVMHTVEGDDAAIRVAEALVSRLGARAVRISENQKALYHAGAVFASNYPVILLQLAVEMLEKCGFSSDEALEGARRLFAQSANACMTAKPLDALTGPAKRRDVSTIERHLETLSGVDEWHDVYCTMLKLAQRLLGWDPKI